MLVTKKPHNVVGLCVYCSVMAESQRNVYKWRVSTQKPTVLKRLLTPLYEVFTRTEVWYFDGSDVEVEEVLSCLSKKFKYFGYEYMSYIKIADDIWYCVLKL